MSRMCEAHKALQFTTKNTKKEPRGTAARNRRFRRSGLARTLGHHSKHIHHRERRDHRVRPENRNPFNVGPITCRCIGGLCSTPPGRLAPDVAAQPRFSMKSRAIRAPTNMQPVGPCIYAGHSYITDEATTNAAVHHEDHEERTEDKTAARNHRFRRFPRSSEAQVLSSWTSCSSAR